MHRHFEDELEHLKGMLVRMGSMAESAVRSAMTAVMGNNGDLAAKIIDQDSAIDAMELEIDNTILDILARHQPVAVDLRFLLAAQKINNDLERIGDHAVNIAESALTMSERAEQRYLLKLPEMAALLKEMLGGAIDGFIHRDARLATAVLEQDDRMDDLNKELFGEMIAIMKERPEAIDMGLETVRVSRNLERVADLATNIAEEVIFIAEARVVKHGMGPR